MVLWFFFFFHDQKLLVTYERDLPRDSVRGEEDADTQLLNLIDTQQSTGKVHSWADSAGAECAALVSPTHSNPEGPFL